MHHIWFVWLYGLCFLVGVGGEISTFSRHTKDGMEESRSSCLLLSHKGWKRAGQVGCSCHTNDGGEQVKLVVSVTKDGRGWFKLPASVTQRMEEGGSSWLLLSHKGWKRAVQAGCSCHTKDGRGRFKLAAPVTQRMEEGGSSWLLLTHKGWKRAVQAGCS